MTTNNIAISQGDVSNNDADCDLYNTINESNTVVSSQDDGSIKNVGKNGFSYYLAVLMFAPFFSKLSKKGIDFILPWLISVLLGAKKIEHTNTLNHSEISIILGKWLKTTRYQRIELKELAKTCNINELWKFNIEMVGLNNSHDYYYDPHTKHYTGLINILKGWCPKVRMADKVMNMDFIHDSNGYPLFMNIADNYDDMRIRFFRNIDTFRKVASIDESVKINIIVDRAIYSEETICSIAERKYINIITWEKDYKKNKWLLSVETQTGSIIRKRNHSHDLRIIKYEYKQMQWDKNPKIRQIIVRMPTPTGDDFIEVSILSSDLDRDAREIIFLMFNRWLQENDFKYLIAHFGINEITTYEYMNYQDWATHIDDKLCKSGKYKALCIELESIRGKLKTVLYKIHRLEQVQRKKELTKQQLKRKEELEKEKSILNSLLISKEKERENTDEKISKIQELIDDQKQILNTDTKMFMDAIKIIARNIFYLQLQSFRQKYNNYRDDLVIFRNVSRSNGVIINHGDQITIKVLPIMDLTPSLIEIFRTIFTEINDMSPVMPDGSNRKIELVLDEKIESFFAFSN
ncbi:hypothetical protein HZA55_01780 [Candidatus Poribacteria bacterium]|nr:hypothetical protein [Candidatus Poribacteria bacterium]